MICQRHLASILSWFFIWMTHMMHYKISFSCIFFCYIEKWIIFHHQQHHCEWVKKFMNEKIFFFLFSPPLWFFLNYFLPHSMLLSSVSSKRREKDDDDEAASWIVKFVKQYHRWYPPFPVYVREWVKSFFLKLKKLVPKWSIVWFYLYIMSYVCALPIIHFTLDNFPLFFFLIYLFQLLRKYKIELCRWMKRGRELSWHEKGIKVKSHISLCI